MSINLARTISGTNLITNGDFSNGTTGWSASAAGTSSFSVLEGMVHFLPTATYEGINSNKIQTIAGHKYYVSAVMQTTDAGACVFFIGLNASSPRNVTTFYAIDDGLAHKYSAVVTCTTSNAGDGYLKPQSVATSTYSDIAVDNVLCIDLTEAFGAGNEPTAVQMDAMLAKYPDSWFDGTNKLITVGDEASAYVGDYQPVNLYAGAHKVAGWHSQTVSGEGTVSLDGAYNVPPDALVIEGKCEQTGTPSPDAPAPITTITGDMGITGCGKNLLNGMAGTLSGSNIKLIPITLVAGQQYTFSVNGLTAARVSLWSDASNTNLTGYLGNGGTSTFTAPVLSTVLLGYESAGQNANYPNQQIQLELGSTATAYEPYSGDTSTIPLGAVELCSLPDGTKDEYDAVTGIVTKRILHVQTAVADMNNTDTYAGWKSAEAPPGLATYLPNVNGSVYGVSSVRAAGTDYSVNTATSTLLAMRSAVFGLTQTEWKTNYPNLAIDFYLKATAPQTIQLTPDLPVVRTGIKSLTLGANITPTFTATVKAMD